MALTLKKGATTSTTQYGTSSTTFSYVISVRKNGTTTQSVNGSIIKGELQIGNFSKSLNSQESINFNADLTLEEKQEVMVAINDIFTQLF
jgi:hypothetical protein